MPKGLERLVVSPCVRPTNSVARSCHKNSEFAEHAPARRSASAVVNKAVLNPERTPVAGPTPLCHKGAPHHLVANPPDAKVTAGITEVGAASIGLLLTRRVRGILQQIEPQLLVYAFG